MDRKAPLACVHASLVRVLSAPKDVEGAWRLRANLCEVGRRIDSLLALTEALRRLVPQADLFEAWAVWLRVRILDVRALPDDQPLAYIHRLRWLLHWQKSFARLNSNMNGVRAQLRALRSHAGRCAAALEQDAALGFRSCRRALEALQQLPLRGSTTPPSTPPELSSGSTRRPRVSSEESGLRRHSGASASDATRPTTPDAAIGAAAFGGRCHESDIPMVKR